MPKRVYFFEAGLEDFTIVIKQRFRFDGITAFVGEEERRNALEVLARIDFFLVIEKCGKAFEFRLKN